MINIWQYLAYEQSSSVYKNQSKELAGLNKPVMATCFKQINRFIHSYCG